MKCLFLFIAISCCTVTRANQYARQGRQYYHKAITAAKQGSGKKGTFPAHWRWRAEPSPFKPEYLPGRAAETTLRVIFAPEKLPDATQPNLKSKAAAAKTEWRSRTRPAEIGGDIYSAQSYYRQSFDNYRDAVQLCCARLTALHWWMSAEALGYPGGLNLQPKMPPLFTVARAWWPVSAWMTRKALSPLLQNFRKYISAPNNTTVPSI